MPRRKTDATATETISESSPVITAMTKPKKPDFEIKINANFWKTILDAFVTGGEGFLQVTRAGLRLIGIDEGHILTENIFISYQSGEIIETEQIADSYNLHLNFGEMFAELKKDTYKTKKEDQDHFTLIYFTGQDLQVKQGNNIAIFRIPEKEIEDQSPFIIQLWKDYAEDLLVKKSVNYFKLESSELGWIVKMFDIYDKDTLYLRMSEQGVEFYDDLESQEILYKYTSSLEELIQDFTPISKSLRLEQLKLMQQKGLTAISRHLIHRQAGKYHESPYSPEELEKAKKGFIQDLKEILKQYSTYFVKGQYSLGFLKLITKVLGKLAVDFPTFYLLWNFNLSVRIPIAPESEVQMILAPRGWEKDEFYVESILVSEILEHLKSSVKRESSDKQPEKEITWTTLDFYR